MILASSCPSSKMKDSVDTSSIIENKEELKSYWESRMMADQGLTSPKASSSGSSSASSSSPASSSSSPRIKQQASPSSSPTTTTTLSTDISLQNPNGKPLASPLTLSEHKKVININNTRKTKKNDIIKNVSGKTTNNEEENHCLLQEEEEEEEEEETRSERKRESSSDVEILSPVETSHHHRFPVSSGDEAKNFPLLSTEKEKLKSCQDQLRVIIDSEETMALTGDPIDDDASLFPVIHASKGVKGSTSSSVTGGVRCLIPVGPDDREENLLSTVIEEQDQELMEQDSLEEFIKHETECGILPVQVTAKTSQVITDASGVSCSVLSSEGGRDEVIREGGGKYSSPSTLLQTHSNESGQTTSASVSSSSATVKEDDARKKKEDSSIIEEEEQVIIINNENNRRNVLAFDQSLQDQQQQQQQQHLQQVPSSSSSPDSPEAGPMNDRVKKGKEEETSSSSTSSFDFNSASSSSFHKNRDQLQEERQGNNKKSSPSETDSVTGRQEVKKHPSSPQSLSSIKTGTKSGIKCQENLSSATKSSSSSVNLPEKLTEGLKKTTKSVREGRQGKEKEDVRRDQQLLYEDQKHPKLTPSSSEQQKQHQTTSGKKQTIISSSSTLMSNCKQLLVSEVDGKRREVKRENLLNEIENYSKSKLKNLISTSGSSTTTSSTETMMEKKDHGREKDVDPCPESEGGGGNNILIQSLEEDQIVMDQVVMDNFNKTSGGKTFADHFLPTEAKGFLIMRSPLPDNDVVTSLDFETLEVAVDDGIASDVSSQQSVKLPKEECKSHETLSSSSPSNTSPNTSLSDLQQGSVNNKNMIIPPASKTCSNNKTNSMNKLASSSSSGLKKCVTGNAKEMIEKRKGSASSSSSSSSNNNLSNYGLLVSKRSSSIKDLREKQNDAEVKIAKEIIELKQREEELKLMRQEINRIQNHTQNPSSSLQVNEKLQNDKQSQNTSKVTGSTRDSASDNKGCTTILTSSSVASVSDVSSVEMDVPSSSSCPRSSSPSSNSEVSTTDSVSGRISVDSLDSSASSAAAKRLMQQNNSHPHNHHPSSNETEIDRKKEDPLPSRSIRSMKPYEEAISEASKCKSRSTSHLNESPIEREIRLVREREEELRREIEMRKQVMQQRLLQEDKQQNQAKVNQDNLLEETGPTDILAKSNAASAIIQSQSSGGDRTSSSPISFKSQPNLSINDSSSTSESGVNFQQTNSIIASSSSLPKSTTSIQKVLATTRIQQEIEEQTQREMALKAVGSIKTISQERTDLKVPPTQLGSMASKAVIAASSASSSSSGVKELVDVLSSKTEFKVKQTDGLTDGLVEDTSSTTEKTLKGNEVLNSMSCGSSSTGSSSTPSVPSVNAIRLGFIKQCNNNKNAIVSMHKFINSKGKTLAAKSNLNRFASHQNLCFNSNTNDYSLQMIGSTASCNENRGIIRASDTPSIISMAPNFKAVRKGTTPAETKIQAEMREMKAREEELRHQRVLARSQGNLTIIVPEGEEGEDASSSGNSSSTSPSSSMKNSSSLHPSTVTATKTSSTSSSKNKKTTAKSNPKSSSGRGSVSSASVSSENMEQEDSDESSSSSCGTSSDSTNLLPKLLGRSIKNSLIAQWESKIQQELQSSS